MRLISQKIKDERLTKLIYRFLKAGYMVNWQYHKTHSGVPQGSICAPILANIYLHELDKFVMHLKTEFDHVHERDEYTPEYNALRVEMIRLNRRIRASRQEEERQRLIEEHKRTRRKLLKTPSKAQTDKKIKYIRYADDWLIGVNGSREECLWIKNRIAEFLGETLRMKLSEEKTLITHSSHQARFLGYDVHVRREAKVKRTCKMKHSKRTLSNMTELTVPLKDKIHKFIFTKGIAIQKADGSLFPVHRPSLLSLSDLEIVTVYNAELRGICNYYSLAANFSKLIYLAYLMEYSCLKTLAAKHRSSIGKIRSKFKDGNGNWGIPYETKQGVKRCKFADYSVCQKAANPTDAISIAAILARYSINTLENRIKAHICELCGSTEASRYEVHHINKLKNLKGKHKWEKAMLAKRRKTLVVCAACHYRIHHP